MRLDHLLSREIRVELIGVSSALMAPRLIVAIDAPYLRAATRPGRPKALPRKEVIQPQLPLRLPCYDFVPITRPTLDASPPPLAGRVGPAASGVAGFRDVTGGVYKTRERIHRGMLTHGY